MMPVSMIPLARRVAFCRGKPWTLWKYVGRKVDIDMEVNIIPANPK